ncbi:hypothetical protein [Acuticoccus sediminis]|uniref:hypothetical protein n=1 Tax=Acuticoccus sediminis TaxID=2184697 RepID=UPI00139167CC|nr:hypothetical protein [Acuticoccus sediminis]
MFRVFGVCAALVAVGLAGCLSNKADLGRDAFVGDWKCGDTRLALSSRSVDVDGKSESIAWIETGGNADYGLFTTKGGHYSVFNTTKRSLTFHDHKGGSTIDCKRA